MEPARDCERVRARTPPQQRRHDQEIEEQRAVREYINGRLVKEERANEWRTGMFRQPTAQRLSP